MSWSGPRAPFVARSSMSLAGCPARGQSGVRAAAANPVSRNAAAARVSCAVGMRMVTVPRGRSSRAMAASHCASSAGAACLASTRLASGAVLIGSCQGGLAMAWSYSVPGAKCMRSAAWIDRPVLWRARAAMAGSISTPPARTPGTRCSRHRRPAPAPQPTSSTHWPGLAGQWAASSTGSIPVR